MEPHMPRAHGPSSPAVQRIFSKPVSRPLLLRSEQDVILVVDGSGSVAPIQQEIGQAVRDLVGELALPANKDAFWLWAIAFDDMAVEILPHTKASQALPLLANFEPCDGRGGSTSYGSAAEAVKNKLVEIKGIYPNHIKPVVLLFGDGGETENAPDKVTAAWQDVGKLADVISVGYRGGSGLFEDFMRSLTSAGCFQVVSNGRELRAFLADVGRTITRSKQRGISVTKALLSMATKRCPGCGLDCGAGTTVCAKCGHVL